MTSENISYYNYECDNCHKKFENQKYISCPSEKSVMECFVGYNSGLVFETKLGYDLGDLCKECQQLLFSIVKDRFPKAKWVKQND